METVHARLAEGIAFRFHKVRAAASAVRRSFRDGGPAESFGAGGPDGSCRDGERRRG